MKSKYFSKTETHGLIDDIIFKLDRARDLFGAPIVITSGFRDIGQNIIAGGKEDSAHTKGMAVDIRCTDVDMQKRLIWALCLSGFRRIGAYDRHVHADVDDTKPFPAFWTGKSK